VTNPANTKATAIVLATLNARYVHASLGLRCLLANMGALRGRTTLCEFTIAQKPSEIAERLLALEPSIIGLGVYIWNVAETTQLVRLLKAVRPEVKLVLGGPEVSFEIEQQEVCRLADHVVTGWGDVSFPKLCTALLDGKPPLMKVLVGEQPPLDQLAMPYREYQDIDIAQRLLYVEASRGCPYKCEFCLSSLDKTAWAFDLERFLDEMDALLARGARQFKFVDRTFNLKIESSARILEFFLARWRPGLFLHFELVPDMLPDRLKQLILRFPAGALQFEVGVQSFDLEVQRRISRKQDARRTEDNLRWLAEASPAHVHADLIFGLPGETLDGFARGFDRLLALRPQEIQVGILKRLRGTPIQRHAQAFGLVYDPAPPYALLHSGLLSFEVVQRVSRFARYWDLFANSGRFKASLPLLLGVAARLEGPQRGAQASPFWRFMAFSDWLWSGSGKTHQFSAEQLVDALFAYLTQESGVAAPTARENLRLDYLASGASGKPASLVATAQARDRSRAPSGRSLQARRQRHAQPQD
jgi:radical SAM superfamily enzyme YgiQ (UPF0313 family)